MTYTIWLNRFYFSGTRFLVVFRTNSQLFHIAGLSEPDPPGSGSPQT